MVYSWCTACVSRVCTNESSHRAQRLIQQKADFILGGRRGKRIRKLFTKREDAVSYEYVTKADFKRGTFLPSKGKITFKELADRYYNEHCLQESHDNSKSQYYRIQMAKKIMGGQLASSITRQQIRELRLKLKDKWEGSTVNRFIGGVLRPIFNKGIEWDLIDENPCTHISKMEEKDPIPRFLTTQEIATLFKSIKDDVLRDYANIILHTGARPSSIEACSFNNGDVDLSNRVIWFTTYKGRRKHRYSHPIDDTLYELLLRRLVDTQGKGQVFSVANIRKLAAQAIKDSHLNDDRTVDQQFTIYGLKHCYASHLLMSGATIFDVAKLLGHTDTKMVIKHYGHLTQEHLREVQSKINLTPKENRDTNFVDTRLTHNKDQF